MVNLASTPHIVRSVASPLSAVLLVLALGCVALPALAADKAAVLPTTGTADADARARLDVAVRKALAKRTDLISLQSAKDTGSHLSSMAELGVICENDDVGCLQKLGIVAGVTRLLIVDASGKRTLDVTITTIDVDVGTILRTTKGEVVVSEAADIADLVTRALEGEPAVRGILDTAEQPAATSSLDPVAIVPATGAVDETALNDMQFAGAMIGGIGGGVFTIGLLSALAAEAIFWTGTGPAATRRDVIAPLGSVMWVVTAVGGVAAITGGIIFLVGAPPSSPTGKLDAE